MSKTHRSDDLCLYREAFDPDQIELLDVVFQNVRAAIGRPLDDAVIRELIAARLFNFALRGERDPEKLYLRTVESYQAVTLPLYVTTA